MRNTRDDATREISSTSWLQPVTQLPAGRTIRKKAGVRFDEMEGTKRCESTRKQGWDGRGWGVDTFVRDWRAPRGRGREAGEVAAPGVIPMEPPPPPPGRKGLC
jgi:hypothetical protein